MNENLDELVGIRRDIHFMVGNGAGPSACMVHNPGHDFNDAALPIGAAYWARLAEAFLADDQDTAGL